MSTLINALLIVLIGLRLVIGLQLFLSARRNRLPNLYWLGGFFIFNFLGVPFAATNGNPLAAWPGALWVFNGLLTLCAIPTLIMFIDTTFYANRRSPRGWLWVAYGGLCAVGLYSLSQSPAGDALTPGVASFYALNALVWGWHVVAAAEARRAIAADPLVERWVKARYQLMIWSAGAHVMAALGNVARVGLTGGELNHPLGNALALVSLVGNLASIGLQFVIWVIPEQFRGWVSRTAARHSAAQATQQAEAIFSGLRAAMAANTGLTEFFAGYALRTVVSRMLNTADPMQVDQQVARLGYHEWLAVLAHPDLGPLLLNAAVGVDVPKALQQAQQALHERQALFTLQSR